MAAGVVEAIFLAPAAGIRPSGVAGARAVAGRGLEGDRYFEDAGTWSRYRPDRAGEDLTLVEAETLEALARVGVAVDAADMRRNVITRGIALRELVGRRFSVGSLECYGDRPCDPCRHLERLTRPGLLTALARLGGGLRANILADGRIELGDPVRALEPPPVR
jgi:MOSC domain-containing protein YiiM